jgi:hypothetical protein
MKAINDNGTIKRFDTVPKAWGNKLGLNYASDSELEAIGFYDVVIPSKKDSQEFGDIEWDADNSRFTYPVNNKTFSESLADLKTKKIEDLRNVYNFKLAETDWYVTRKQEKNIDIPSDVATDRNNLRSDYETHKTAINGKTSKAAVVDYALPIL